ncbi:hypothetical protein A5676_04420 [Mycobacterium malmoense]|nr:hypothetical protein A5676_04420 [Mycobacterium malmoense]
MLIIFDTTTYIGDDELAPATHKRLRQCEWKSDSTTELVCRIVVPAALHVDDVELVQRVGRHSRIRYLVPEHWGVRSNDRATNPQVVFGV